MKVEKAAWPGRLAARLDRATVLPVSVGHSRADREWLLDLSAYLACTALLAVVTHHAAQPLGVLGDRLLSLWVPLGFGLLALVVAVLSKRMSAQQRRAAYAADIAAWATPIVFVLIARMGGTPDVASWIALTLAAKAGADILAICLSVRAGAPDLAAGLALAILAFVIFALAIPTTRLLGAATRAAGLAGDEPHYMVTVVSLVRDHDLYLEDEYAQPLSYWSFYPAFLAPGHTAPARDGHRSSFHDFGMPILATVPFVLGGWKAVLVAVALASGIVLREAYALARLAGVSPVPALAACAVAGFSLPFAGYANEFFPEIPIALATVVATRLIWAKQAGRGSSPLAVGLVIATLPWLHARAWPLALVLAATGMAVWRRWGERLAVGLPLVVAAAGYVALTSYVFGRFLLTPDFGQPAVQAHHLPALGAIVIGQARPWLDARDGLLMLAPVFILALAAAPQVVRMGWAGAGMVGAVAAYSVGVGLWELFSVAGWGPPGRFMVPVMPFLTVLLAVALDRMRARGWAVIVVAALVAWGLIASFYATADRVGVYADNVVATLASVLGVPLSIVTPNFISPGIASFAKVTAALAVIALAAVLLSSLRQSVEPTRSSGAPVQA